MRCFRKVIVIALLLTTAAGLFADTFNETDNKLILADKRTGTYCHANEKTGIITWNLTIDKDGVARFSIFEDGIEKDLTTSSEDTSVLRSTIYTLSFRNGIDAATGKIRRNQNGIWTEIEIPGGGKELAKYLGSSIKIISKYGYYSLGSIDTAQIEKFLFTREMLDEAIGYLNGGKYKLALDTFNVYRSEYPESFEFYEAESRVTECERKIAKQLYESAVRLIKEERYFEAIDRFEDLYRDYPAYYKRYKADVLVQEARGIKQGTRFNISISYEPLSMDPHLITTINEQRIMEAMFEGLVSSDPKTTEAIPAIAEAWDFSADGKTVVFHLRKGLTWSDGTPLNSDDFVFSWLRCLAPETESPYAWLLAMFIEGAAEYNAGTAGKEAVKIEAPDNYTLKVSLTGNYPFFLGALTYSAFSAVPRHVIEKYGKDWIKPENIVCNGAFTLEEYIKKDHILLSKNQKYWDKQYVKLDEVNFIFINKSEDAYKMYLSGDIDWVTNAPKSSSLRADYQTFELLSSHYYVVNTQKKYLYNPNVRRAMSIVIDRDTLVESLSKNYIPTWGIVPEIDGYSTIEKPSSYTDQYAQRILASAGFPGGEGFPKLNVLCSGSEKIDEFVVKEWKNKLGIESEITVLEWDEFQDRIAKDDFDVAMTGWVGDYADPTTFLNVFSSASGLNDSNYYSKGFDGLLYYASLQSGKSRMDTLRKAEEQLITADAAVFGMIQDAAAELINVKKWGGWYKNVMDIHPVKEIFRK